MVEIKNVPAIRFKGFYHEWIDMPFHKTFSTVTNNTLSRAELSYSSGTVKNVHYGDVLIKFGELLDAEEDEIPFISNEALASKYKTSKLQDGDVVIADAAEDETVGKCTEITNIGNQIIVSGLHTIPVRPELKFASKYLGYYMNSNAFHNQLLRLMQGTKVLSISKTAIKDTLVVFPSVTDEQSQIGSYFQHLDQLISLHQTKVNKLTNLKKAMLEKMFPKPGADVPEIRFKGFAGAWEEKTLKQIVCNVSDGNWIEADHIYEEGEYRIIQTGNLGLGEFIDKSGSAKYFHQKDFNEVNGNEIFPGDILISRLADPAGRAVLLPQTGFKMVTAVDVSIIRPNSSMFDSSFLITQLNTKKILNLVNESVSGTSHKRISRRNLEKVKLLAPTVKEQEKIGKYFQNLNKTIFLHQTELEKLTNLKKACLEKMFV